ncbi:MAG: hypothetical protein JNL01_13455 [Bdellovibrionales bacterium]|nr:hypothetical protein [Bdellovibrionales bacterium]
MKRQTMKPLMLSAFAALAALTAIGFSGCMGNQRQGVAAGLVTEQPFTEAYVEFTGPGERWGGPTTFAIQVYAKDEKALRVQILPKGIFKKKISAPEIKNRGLASVPANVAELKPLNLAQMRDRLAGLSEIIDEGSGNFSGCLYPVKVRMVRTDGGVKDWQGCRGGKGSSKGVSEFAADLLAIYAAR